MTTMTMTTRKTGNKQQYGWLKAAVATGSLAATFLGARLLAAEDARATAVPLAPTPIVITVPMQAFPATSAAAPSSSAPAAAASSANGGQLLLDLPPIPQVVAPALQPPPPPPVANSRSSQ
ncbi:MAG: hypothetical protein D8M54_12295 [Chloroflexi bacterium]|nr:hypothetical protein [Chloroflexota bacterium]